ncbi:MAG: type II toxin-antitoxin system RelE/ParE family toxin [Candidatus Hydrogenedens sp.]|nr:type II toxin-antitoxin system RelE/ParE family toxin [Candidatus Hydrogenedens sp.]
MTYSVEMLRSAQKQLGKIQKDDQVRIVDAIRSLSGDPRPRSAKKLTNRPAWRIRVGVYRVIYEIEDEVLRVLVVAVAHRKDIYRPS